MARFGRSFPIRGHQYLHSADVPVPVSASDVNGTTTESGSVAQPGGAGTDVNSTTTEATTLVAVIAPTADANGSTGETTTQVAAIAATADANSTTTESATVTFATTVTDADTAVTDTGTLAAKFSLTDADTAVTDTGSLASAYSLTDADTSVTDTAAVNTAVLSDTDTGGSSSENATALTPGSGAPAGWVTNHATDSSAVANTSAQFSFLTAGAVATGDFLVLAVGCSGGYQVSSVSGGGLTWTVDEAVGGLTIISAQCPSGLAARTTITVNLNSTTNNVNRITWTLDEFSGILSASATDKVAGTTGASGLSFSSGATATTAQADEIVYGAALMDSLETSWTPGSGFTAIDISPIVAGSTAQKSLVAEWKLVSATGTYTATGSYPTTATSVAAVVTYKAVVNVSVSGSDSGTTPGETGSIAATASGSDANGTTTEATTLVDKTKVTDGGLLSAWDTFNRTLAATTTLGTTTSGLTWTRVSNTTTGNYVSIDGAAAKWQTTANTTLGQNLAAAGLANVDVTARFWWDATPNGATLQVFLNGRGTAATDAISAGLILTTAAGLSLRLRKLVASASTTLGGGDLTLASGVVPGTVWNVRLQCLGQDVKAKAWLDGTDEPDWQITDVDTSVTGTAVSLRTQGNAGATVNPIVSIDDLYAYAPNAVDTAGVAQTAPPDSGTASSEAGTLAAALPDTDTGSGADTATVAAALSDAETGAGTDAITGTGVTPPGDSGSSTEAGSASAATSVTDTGSGSESVPGIGVLATADTGTDTETFVLAVNHQTTDSGTASAETTSLVVTGVTATDSGTGSETSAVQTDNAKSDVDSNGTTTENAVVTVVLSGADANQSVTETPVEAVALSDADANVTAADLVDVNAVYAISDLTGVLVDTANLLAVPIGSDGNATVTESVFQAAQLPVGEGPTYLIDSFTRLLASDWGRPDYGPPWAVEIGSSADFNVDTHQATLHASGSGATRQIRSPLVAVRDVEVLAAVAWDTPAAGANHSIRLLARKTGDTSYQAVLTQLASDGSLQLGLVRMVAGTPTAIGGLYPVGASYTLGESWWIRFQVFGQTIRARSWQDGFTEPTFWQTLATEPDIASGDEIAVRGQLGVGATADNTWSVDSMVVQDPVYGAGGLVVDAPMLGVLYATLDTGSGADAGLQTVDRVTADTGSSTEVVSETAALVDTDTGVGVDVAQVTRLSFVVGDSGVGADTADAMFAARDTGSSSETASVTVYVEGDDLGVGSDSQTRRRDRSEQPNRIWIYQPAHTVDVLQDVQDVTLLA